ncbi:MAG TPA: rod shape-determining protein RodA [Roseivirga sp.]
MRREGGFFGDLDWLVVFLYFILVAMGWLNIFASVYDPVQDQSIFDLSLESGKQLLWIGTALILITIILLLDFRIYETFAPIFYAITIILLVAVLIFGVKINGARAWFEFGSFRLQPAEFTKLTTALILAKYISTTGVKLSDFKTQVISLIPIVLPIGLIILQPDAGSAMVFSILILPLYREGFPGIYLLIGLSLATIFILTMVLEQQTLFIGVGVLCLIAIILQIKSKGRIFASIAIAALLCALIFTTSYIQTEVLKPYQLSRIEAILKPSSINPQAEGWNLEQSKIAIGSGGFAGKGFLEGTQTKFGYVPEQSTDFIFSTLAEEHGWLGCAFVIFLFIALILRLVFIAERQKSTFGRFYGYSVASILFFHFTINISMTLGLFPVVGIPLPFFSYGGSSLWSFTILLFVLLKIDMHRAQVLSRY